MIINMDEYTDQRLRELIEASKPLREFLNKYYHPHAYAIVTEGRVEGVECSISAPLPIRN